MFRIQTAAAVGPADKKPELKLTQRLSENTLKTDMDKKVIQY